MAKLKHLRTAARNQNDIPNKIMSIFKIPIQMHILTKPHILQVAYIIQAIKTKKC
jgi:hypothetical protein